MKTIEVNHVYDYYPLYKTVFGLTPLDIHGEALATMLFTERWLEKHRPDLWKTGLNIFEIFSGTGEHKKYYTDHATFPILSYKENDINTHPGIDPSIIIGNACSIDYGGNIDLVLAQYLTAITVMDENMFPTREPLAKLFHNVYRNLNKGGAFMLAMADDAYRESFSHIVTTPDSQAYDDYFIPYNSQLRADFGMPATDGYVNMRIHATSVYDRVTSTVQQTLNRIEISLDGKIVGKIKLKLPFITRYWSEPELIDMSKEAGFKTFMFYQEGDNVGEDILLDTVETETFLTADELMPTKILFIKD